MVREFGGGEGEIERRRNSRVVKEFKGGEDKIEDGEGI